jgi:hypothetical protein
MYDIIFAYTSYHLLLTTSVYTHSTFCRYELRAIQKEKIRRMETENGKSKEVITVEVEMQESKGSSLSRTSERDLESQV